MKLTIIIILVLIGAYVFWFVCAPMLWTILGIRDTMSKKVVLLYKSNHDEILRACQELHGRYQRGDLKPRFYRVAFHGDPEVKSFPKAILALRPASVRIDKTGSVTITVGGGMSHFGVIVFPEGHEKTMNELGDKELIPSLWYFDVGYRENPKFEQIIQSLKPKA